ncbi:hypothetical protein BGZ74_005044, partial [Mortierella antarctica]
AAKHNIPGADATPGHVILDSTHLIFKFWHMNMGLPETEQFAFFPRPSYQDSFMDLSEIALVPILWPVQHGPPYAHLGTHDTMIKQFGVSRQQALDMALNNYGSLVKLLFFPPENDPTDKPEDDPNNDPKTIPKNQDNNTAFGRRLVTQQQLQDIPPPPKGKSKDKDKIKDSPFSTQSLKQYHANKKQYNIDKKKFDAKQISSEPIKPELPKGDPNSLGGCCYVLMNMIHTNGLELQVLVYDLCQAQPPPLSTHAHETCVPIPKVEDLYSGGKTIDTVFPTYDKNKDVIIVGLDPGERVTVAACGININPDLVSQNLEETPMPVSNLVVKRSALYQPILHHRLAMEALKTSFDLPVTLPQGVSLPQGAPPIAASSVVYPLVTSVQNQLTGYGGTLV